MKLSTQYSSRNSSSKPFIKYEPTRNATTIKHQQEIQNAQNLRDNYRNKQNKNLRRQLLNMVDTKDLLALVNNNYNSINLVNANDNVQHPRMQQN